MDLSSPSFSLAVQGSILDSSSKKKRNSSRFSILACTRPCKMVSSILKLVVKVVSTFSPVVPSLGTNEMASIPEDIQGKKKSYDFTPSPWVD